MVQRGIEVGNWFKAKLGAAFYMENPVGSLERRPYMVEWERQQGVVKHMVHYCAFDHWYMKPTNLWLSSEGWQPRGRTGTGLCMGECKWGQESAKGHWEHIYKIAQGSKQAKTGKGRKARKNMMPLWLQQELVGWAQWVQQWG